MTKFFQHLSQETHISMEMIEFQKDSYARDLEVTFSLVLKAQGSERKQLLNEIVETTFKRTGLKIKFVTNGSPAAVLPFYINEYHVFLDKMFHGHVSIPEQRKLMKSALEHKGTVDTKKCKVTGIFSQYEIPLHLNFNVLTKMKLTPGEITGVFLHELGHAFSSCEYSNRMNTTNQVLQNLLDKVLTKTVTKDYLFKELKTINAKTTDEELDKILSGQNTVLGRETFGFIKDTVESQMTRSRYDQNAFETVADNFATRWGYGKEVITALEKLVSNEGYNAEDSILIATIASLASIVIIIVLAYFIVMSLSLFLGTYTVGSFFTVLFFSFLLFMNIVGHSSYANNMTYDDTVYRYKRIRNQYVELLKDTSLNPAQTKMSIETIKLIDEIISNKKGYKNLVTIVLDFLTPSGKKIDDDVKMQRVLEELSANDLYIASAMLRTH